MLLCYLLCAFTGYLNGCSLTTIRGYVMLPSMFRESFQMVIMAHPFTIVLTLSLPVASHNHLPLFPLAVDLVT